MNLSANTSKITLTKCTGNTGKSGTSTGTAAPPTTEVLKWKNAKSTTIGSAATPITLGTGTLCPATSSSGLSLVADETETGPVTKANTKSTAKGAGSAAEVCVYGPDSSGNFGGQPGAWYEVRHQPLTKQIQVPVNSQREDGARGLAGPVFVFNPG